MKIESVFKLNLFAKQRMPPIPIVGGLASLGFHKIDETETFDHL